MFGFVNVYKYELKVKDYNLFKAYYCGLCKALGKRHNQLVRLGLSYDMTFLSIIADSLNEEQCQIVSEGCIKHIGNRPVIVDNKAINYTADVSILLAYHKLCDDISDDNSIKARLAKIAYLIPHKKVCKKYPGLSLNIKNNLQELAHLEEAKCDSIDMVAHPFANLMSNMFSAFNSSLSDIGYDIGRFIYIADAYKDLSDDAKKSKYNPYLYAYDNEYIKSDAFKKSVMGSLNMTLSAISDKYKELNIKKNKEILDNIIYLGLRMAYDSLFTNNGGNK